MADEPIRLVLLGDLLGLLAGVPRDYMKDLSFVIMTMYHEKFKDLPIAFAR